MMFHPSRRSGSALFSFAVAALLLLHPLHAQARPEKFDFDAGHTRIVFFVSHTGFSNMVGRIKEMNGFFVLDPKNPTDGKVEVVMKADSVDTDHAGLNEKLRGENFFNTEKFPEITFASTRIKQRDKNHGELTGNLTLLGVTRPVTLQVALNKVDFHPITQKYTAGFTATGEIKRSDFGMNYGLPSLIGDVVQIHIEAEGINVLKQPDAPGKHPAL